ncbi:hypothetical protein HYW58_01015 [Candidatus Kaiserbacteria bacterium]|nr:hypothetical protein [Candidatus Kaiserbacteria bacterium]
MNTNNQVLSFGKIILGVCVVLLALSFFSFGRNDSSVSPYLEAAQAGGDYLLRQLRDDGSFVYQYNPVTEKVSSSYNIIRHAGTSYSLLELYEATNDKKYLMGAERALEYLKNQNDSCPGVPFAHCILYENKIQLGGNALAVLAFVKHAEVSGSDFYLDEAKSLAQFIISSQSPAGEFLIHSMNATTGVIDDFTSVYYPGEAVFALTRLYALDKDEKWISAAHRGAHFLINTRDPKFSAEELGNNHWLMYALNELHEHRENSLYIADMKRLVDAIVLSQHTGKSGTESGWNGGYYTPPRSTPTAIRSEGLIAAYNLFFRVNETGYAEKALESIKQGVDFALRTQFTPEKIMVLKANPKGTGGFHRSLDNYNVRIDYVQHNISALIGFNRILKTAENI